MTRRLSDPWILVTFGATSTRDRDDLATVQQVLHDQLIDDLGEHRTGPVEWRRWAAPDGLRFLERNSDVYPKTRDARRLLRFLAANPDGYLVIASAPSDLDETGPNTVREGATG